MKQQYNFIKYVSMIYRQGNRFYDKKLVEYHIGSGQNFFLVCIYEYEGISMYGLARMGHFDKGTVTKGIQKLEEQGYIRIEADAEDKRIRRLYTTDRAVPIIEKIYDIRQEWSDALTVGLTPEERAQAEHLLGRMAENAWKCMNERELDRE